MAAQETKYLTTVQAWEELGVWFLIPVNQQMYQLCVNLEKKYRTVFDSWNGNRFILHKPDCKMIIFEQHPCGLYYYYTNKKVESSSSNDGMAVCDAYKRSKLLVTNVAKTIRLFTTTVAEQMTKFTHRQVAHAKESC